MSTYKANEQDQKRAENIRRQCVSREDNLIVQLEKLDIKVKRPGKSVSVILGVLGALVLGAGMSLIMVWENMTLGLSICIPGFVVALLAYPVYALITNNRKKKYRTEIMRLSDALITE